MYRHYRTHNILTMTRMAHNWLRTGHTHSSIHPQPLVWRESHPPVVHRRRCEPFALTHSHSHTLSPTHMQYETPPRTTMARHHKTKEGATMYHRPTGCSTYHSELFPVVCRMPRRHHGRLYCQKQPHCVVWYWCNDSAAIQEFGSRTVVV